MKRTAPTTDTHVASGRHSKSLSSAARVSIIAVDGQSSEPSTLRGRPFPHVPGVQVEEVGQDTVTSFPHGPAPLTTNVNVSSTQRARRASAAEKVLEQLRNKDLQRTSSTSPRSTWLHKPKEEGTRSRAASMLASVAATAVPNVAEHHAPSGASTQASAAKNVKPAAEVRRPHISLPSVPPPSPVIQKGALPPIRPRLSRSPSAPHLTQQQQQITTVIVSAGPQSGPHARPPPQELISLLDGDHHTDELSVRFEAGWPLLEQWLVSIGKGTGNSDYGRVSMIYR